jgi:hypothetical protein
MKIQQRSFVVEYKSARRHLVKQPSSIWGDTNFKELVRQTEEETPQLFDKAEASGVSTLNAKSAIEAKSSHGAAVAPVLQPSVDDGEALESADEQAIYPPPQTVEVSSIRRVRKIYRRETRDRKDQLAMRISGARNGEAADELALLEDENRRLKALLTRQLLEENIRLRGMLERFQIA